MSYVDQDMFFAQAYRTGTDRWSHIPFARRAHELTLHLKQDALVLDIGAGRGKVMFDLAALGYRSIGLENNQELVTRGNADIKEKGLENRIRFIHGDVLDIPLADDSFDGLIDVGLFQHLLPKDYDTYVSETARVIKKDGYFFLVVLSKNTQTFFTWKPILTETADYELEGVHYHFFTNDEIEQLFGKEFEVTDITLDSPFGEKDTIYSIVLLKKK